MSASLGKRERERMKLEKAQAKAERKARREASEVLPRPASSTRSESELIEDLRRLQQAFEAGKISLEDFEQGRDGIQAEFAQLS